MENNQKTTELSLLEKKVLIGAGIGFLVGGTAGYVVGDFSTEHLTMINNVSDAAKYAIKAASTVVTGGVIAAVSGAICALSGFPSYFIDD